MHKAFGNLTNTVERCWCCRRLLRRRLCIRLGVNLYFQAQGRVLQTRTSTFLPHSLFDFRSGRSSSVGMRFWKAPSAHDSRSRDWNHLRSSLCSVSDIDDLRYRLLQTHRGGGRYDLGRLQKHICLWLQFCGGSLDRKRWFHQGKQTPAHDFLHDAYMGQL